MFELLTAKLLDDLDAITCAHQAYLDIEVMKETGKPQLNVGTIAELKAHAQSLSTQCADLGLPGTKDAAEDLIGWLDKALVLGIAHSAIQTIPHDIFVRILNSLREVPQIARRELRPRLIFMISPEHHRFYRPTKGPLFGLEVDNAFEGIRYDIEEGGKCFATERSTAAVFHFVRCLEAGLRAMARCLGMPEPQKGHDQSWGEILRGIRTEINRRWPTQADRFSGDGKVFNELYGALAAIKSPYRDNTMHLQEKYVEGEARHIFEMVKGLMERIAARIDEKGEPKLPRPS